MKGLAVSALAALLACALVGCDDSGDAPQATQAQAPAKTGVPDQSAPVPEQPEADGMTPTENRDLAVKLATLTDIHKAIQLDLPLMTDENDAPSQGTILFAEWAAMNMTWKALESVKPTSWGMVMKNSSAVRGRRICASGTVVQIQDQTPTHSGADTGQDIFSGAIIDDEGNPFRFVAVKSTGDIVARSSATFCGIVMGTDEYSNTVGGTAQTVRIVGMFKLPENMK